MILGTYTLQIAPDPALVLFMGLQDKVAWEDAPWPMAEVADFLV